jgi:hypothetical protein
MLPFDQVVLVENSYMLASCSKSSGCIIHARRRKNIYTDVIATVIRHLQGWLLNTIIVYHKLLYDTAVLPHILNVN